MFESLDLSSSSVKLSGSQNLSIMEFAGKHNEKLQAILKSNVASSVAVFASPSLDSSREELTALEEDVLESITDLYLENVTVGTKQLSLILNAKKINSLTFVNVSFKSGRFSLNMPVLSKLSLLEAKAPSTRAEFTIALKLPDAIPSLTLTDSFNCPEVTFENFKVKELTVIGNGNERSLSLQTVPKIDYEAITFFRFNVEQIPRELLRKKLTLDRCILSPSFRFPRKTKVDMVFKNCISE